ncbi:MAG: response regulator transcription factor [Acidimicrobiales bacterium]
MTAIRVLVADDHPTFTRTVSLLLADEAGVEVVGTASDGDEAVARTLELRPDVVLMDLQMPGTNGIDATRQIVEAAPHVSVIVLTMFDDDESVIAALRSGARGYLLKGARQADIMRAIEAAHNGEAILGSGVARRLAGMVEAHPAEDPSGAFPALTNREIEVLDKVAAGLDNRAISAALFLSEKTVRNYVSTVMAKIHAASRAEAIVRARDAGLGAR